jgi:hypothetical protein
MTRIEMVKVMGSTVALSAGKKKTVETDSPRGSVGQKLVAIQTFYLKRETCNLFGRGSREGGQHSEVSILPTVTHKSLSEYTHTHCHTSITITCVTDSTVLKILNIARKTTVKHFEPPAHSTQKTAHFSKSINYYYYYIIIN